MISSIRWKLVQTRVLIFDVCKACFKVNMQQLLTVVSLSSVESWMPEIICDTICLIVSLRIICCGSGSDGNSDEVHNDNASAKDLTAVFLT